MALWYASLAAELEERAPDPTFEGVSDEALVETFSVEASALAAQTCRWLLMLAELLRRGVWARHGAKGPGAWLSWKVGMAPSTAREHIRVAIALADWPEVTARFAAGELSYSKVRAITSTGTPGLERTLVEFATQATGAQLHRIVRLFTRSLADELPDPYEAREARFRDLGNGLAEIRILAPVDEALAAWNATERRAVQLARDEHRATAAAAADEAPTEAATPVAARRADAALEAFALLDRGLPADTSGEDRHLVVLHTTAAAAAAPRAGQDRLIPVTDDRGRALPGMSARMLRRLSCTGRVRRVEHAADGAVTSVRDERRYPTAKQRTQLLLRDGGCRFPGCESRHGLHAHHIVHWEDGGPTELHNLLMLCGHHHRFVHDRGWRILHDGAGHVRFQPPGEPVVATAGVLPRTDLAPLPLEDWVDALDPDDWHPRRHRALLAKDGTPADYDSCLFVLHQALERLRPPTSEAVPAVA